tara:strand:- start:6024 stop:6263 length:240 start_codon:yes stop_codon:yes gene_type:complete
MFNNIINNSLFISTLALSGGVVYKCLKDFHDEYNMTNNTYISHSNSIFNSGMFIGTLVGITTSYLNYSIEINKVVNIEN